MIETSQHPGPDTINAYVDLELPADAARDTQQHMVGCHSCALRVLSATQLKVATTRAGRCFAPTPEVVARLTARLHAEPGPVAQVHSFRPVAWGSLAAAFVLAVSLLGWTQLRHSNTLAAELLDQHLAMLSSGASPEVISTDRHTVKPWFQGKLPFSFNLPDVLPADTTLKGANLAYLNGQPAALLLFTIHKHEVSVFLTQRSGTAIATTPSGIRSGFNIHYASTHDLRIVAVSDVNPADLQLLLSALVQAQSSS